MTTFTETEKNCFVCDETNKYIELTSSNRFGAPDLDTRPPEMMRSTIHSWIQDCPSCGYCAPDISKGPKMAVQLIESESYLRQSSDKAYPKTASKFLCWSMIQEAAGDHGDAGWAAAQAAWVCDDHEVEFQASTSRQRAMKLFEKARTNGIEFAESLGAEDAIMADLLRRSGDFEKAEALCIQSLKNKQEDYVEKILEFQRFLSQKQDAKCYTVDDMEEYRAV